METTALLAPPAPLQTGADMHALLERLFPICRSITGNGVRQTLAVVQEYLPELQLREVPSGTPVLDWQVPAEWNIRDAWVKNAAGERVVDFQQHNLHVLGYSIPVHGWFSRAELEAHLFSLPEQPDLIPYRTSYYEPAWGFCLRHHDRLALQDDYYEVCIESTLDAQGSLSYAELLLPATEAGEEPAEEVLLSCHCCHPSLANDNLSGLVVAVALARGLAAQPVRRYAYRFVFGPGTIGSITWLALNRETVGRIRHGLVLTLLGGSGAFTYKQSRRSCAAVDQAAALALRDTAAAHHIRPWLPYGYDERQYCSPGFNLPVGCLSRTPFGEFAEYHTSADNLELVRPAQLAEALQLVQRLCHILEHNCFYRNLQPYGEPQLGRRGLYKGVGGGTEGHSWHLALLWVLSLSDGQHSLLQIAEQAALPFELIAHAAHLLAQTDLLERLDSGPLPDSHTGFPTN